MRAQGSPLIAWAGGRRGAAVTQHVDVNVEICFPCCSYVFTQRVGSVSLFCFEIKQPASPRIAINIVTKRSTTNRNNINVGYLTLLEQLLNLVVDNWSIVAQTAVLLIK